MISQDWCYNKRKVPAGAAAPVVWIERQENNMHISYKPLWHTLLERDMRKEDLRLAAGMTTNMIANMGFMFLIIACALLALQFLTQMQTTKSRYLTLSILGARREQIKRSINQQVLWYFLLPLILACISGAVGIYAMQLYLYSGAAHLEQSYFCFGYPAFT